MRKKRGSDRRDLAGGPGIDALNLLPDAWVQAVSNDELSRAFSELLNLEMTELSWSDTSGLETHNGSASKRDDAFLFKNINVAEVGSATHGGPAVIDRQSGGVRLPILLERIVLAGEGGRRTPYNRRVQIRSAALECDALATQHRDLLTGRPYVIFSGFAVRNSGAVGSYVDGESTTTFLRSSHSPPWERRLFGSVANLLEILLRTGPAVDRFQSLVNRWILERETSTRVQHDALSLAGENPPRIGVKMIEKIANDMGAGAAYAALGAPTSGAGPTGWNAHLRQRLIALGGAEDDARYSELSIAFRVDAAGQLFTGVSATDEVDEGV